MLEPSLATATRKAKHRFTTAIPHSANGHGEPSLGRSADPRRAVETRNHPLGTHGVAVSPDRLTGPSQTWRTFLANHLGKLAFASTVTSLFGESDDDSVDACGLPFRPVPPSRDGLKVRDAPGLHLAEGLHVGLRPSDSEALRRHRQALGHSVRNHRW
jgi:hypothetical protein